MIIRLNSLPIVYWHSSSDSSSNRDYILGYRFFLPSFALSAHFPAIVIVKGRENLRFIFKS